MNIYGAGGHAKVILDILDSQQLTVDNIIDDNEDLAEFEGYDVVHAAGENMLQIGTIIAVGNNKCRKKLSEEYRGLLNDFIGHATAVVSPSSTIGLGTVIMANATINPYVTIGRHCIINTGSVIEHEVVIEDFVHISPNASIAGEVRIGEGAHIGIGACIIERVRIGKWVTVGAGAVIISDIPDFSTVVGNPGKIIKFDESI